MTQARPKSKSTDATSSSTKTTKRTTTNNNEDSSTKRSTNTSVSRTFSATESFLRRIGLIKPQPSDSNRTQSTPQQDVVPLDTEVEEISDVDELFKDGADATTHIQNQNHNQNHNQNPNQNQSQNEALVVSNLNYSSVMNSDDSTLPELSPNEAALHQSLAVPLPGLIRLFLVVATAPQSGLAQK